MSDNVDLRWIVRKSNKLEHRSIAEFLSIPSSGQGLIYSLRQFTATQILDKLPVDVIVDFSPQDGIDYYLDEASKRNVAVITAISQYLPRQINKIQDASTLTTIVYSPNITVGINFFLIAAKILKQIAPYADTEIIEEHFKQKPKVSGTSKIIADSLSIKFPNYPLDIINNLTNEY